jgi:murein DD-endopeptidase MepM/ murein hydrolase activator NlpD
MCEPTVLLGLSIVSTLATLADTAQQANANEDALIADANNQVEAIGEQQDQISKKAIDEKQDRSQQAAMERGRLRAIQAESGLIGNTQDRIIGESYFNESTDIASIEANRKNEIAQSNRQLQGVTTSTQSKLNSIKQPNYLGAGLQIGTAVFGYKQQIKTTK